MWALTNDPQLLSTLGDKNTELDSHREHGVKTPPARHKELLHFAESAPFHLPPPHYTHEHAVNQKDYTPKDTSVPDGCLPAAWLPPESTGMMALSEGVSPPILGKQLSI